MNFCVRQGKIAAAVIFTDYLIAIIKIGSNTAVLSLIYFNILFKF